MNLSGLIVWVTDLMFTFLPIMEVKNGSLEDEFRLQRGHFPLPLLWERRGMMITMVVNCGRISLETWKSEVANFSIFAAEFKGPSLC